jgi:pre-rRNA-processing protein IPI3
MECILVSAAGTTSLYDLANRTILSTYRDSSPAPRGVAPLQSPMALGCAPWPSHFVTAQAGVSSAHVHSYGHDAPIYRCALSEGLLSVAASGDGSLLAGGGASGRAYLWDTATGELLREWQAHYKAVGALAFSPCGALLASGGDDGLAHCWDAAALLEGAGAGAAPQAAATWSGHTMAVTFVCFSPLSGLFGGAAAARLVTCSADCSVRWWDVATRRCLRAVALPAGAACACPNADGSRWFVGCVDGVVYALEGEGAGGGGSGGGGAAPPRAFWGHTAAVTALCLAQGGRTLLSASDDGSVRLWDADAKTQVGSLGAASSAAVTAMLLLPLRPPGLAGGGRAPPLPVRAVAPLRKHAGLHAAAAMGGGGGGDRVAILRLLCGGGGGTGAAEDEERAVEAAFAAVVAGTVGDGGASGNATAAAAAHPAEEAAALKAQVEALKSENARWKAAATRLIGGAA